MVVVVVVGAVPKLKHRCPCFPYNLVLFVTSIVNRLHVSIGCVTCSESIKIKTWIDLLFSLTSAL